MNQPLGRHALIKASGLRLVRSAGALAVAIAAALGGFLLLGHGSFGPSFSLRDAAASSTSAPDLQVRPVVSTSTGACSAPSPGQDPAVSTATTLPFFRQGLHRCYGLGSAQVDVSQVAGVMEQWSPQGETVGIELTNEQAASLSQVASANSGGQTAIVMFGQVL